MDPTEELKALEAALIGNNPIQRTEDDLVKSDILWGYSRLQGRINLLFTLEPARGDLKLESFGATLGYKRQGSASKQHSVYSSGVAMDTDLIRSQLALDRPDHHPLDCSWEIVAMVRVSFNELRRWQKNGAFLC